ncbi:MAG TPA: dynamin family protein [Candidatus Fermentibacter daniensis]|nr:MAG: Bacterial dynamin-like protein [candidate division Hyd24-12 bacterium ADurb.Bin004]HPH40673.1 dynamin family protein [Candidatus Fermentibacter daniensis]
MLAEYQERKTRLLEAFGLIKTSNFLPCGSAATGGWNEASVTDVETNLKENKFYVSICGQMKAGKSTFMNYLLFENDREVLPTDPVPWTAKLTMVQNGSQEKSRILFYTEKEWEQLKLKGGSESKEEKSYFNEFIQPAIDRAASKGIYTEQLIAKERKTLELPKIDQLKEYVTAEGLYTPFVQSTEVTVPCHKLQNVILVDTPGINDPDESRSRITTEWIGKSSAVVYLFLANQALSQADIDFIDVHLASVPAEFMVFALSKADLVKSGSISTVEAYIEANIPLNPRLAAREILKGKRVHPISTIAGVIHNLEAKGEPLSEKLAFHKTRIPPEVIEQKGWLDELFAAIDAQIMRNSGEAVLKKAETTLNAICTRKELDICSSLEQIAAKRKSIGLDKGELEARRKGLVDALRKFSSQKDDLNTQIGNEIKRIQKYAISRETAVVSQAEQELEDWVNAQSNPGEAIRMADLKISRIVQKAILSLSDEAVSEGDIERVQELCRKLQQDLNSTLKKATASTDRPFIPVADVRQLLDETTSSVGAISYEDCRRKLLFWTKKGETLSAIKNKGAHLINEQLREVRGKLLDGFSTQLFEHSKIIIAMAEEHVESVRNELEKVATSAQSKDDMLREVQIQETGILQEQKRVQAVIEKIRDMIGVK